MRPRDHLIYSTAATAALYPWLGRGSLFFLLPEVFHPIEAQAVLAAAACGLGSPPLVAAFWGCIFHISLDIVAMYRLNILFKRPYSFVEYFVRKRLMLKRGFCPA